MAEEAVVAEGEEEAAAAAAEAEAEPLLQRRLSHAMNVHNARILPFGLPGR